MKKSVLFTFTLLMLLAPILVNSSYLNVSWSLGKSSIYPGSQTQLTLTLTNTFSKSITNVKIYASSSYLSITPNYLDVGTIAPSNSLQTSLKIVSSEGLKSGTYLIDVRIEYYLESSKYETTLKVPLEVISKPSLILKGVEYHPKDFEPGNKINLTFTLSNQGEGAAKDVKIVLNQSILYFETNEVYLFDIQPNQEKKINLNAIVNPSIQPNVYLIPIYISYWDENKDNLYQETKTFSLQISSKPKVSVSLDKFSLFAMEENTITITVSNSGSMDIRFLTINVSSDLLKATQQIYVGDLDSDDYDIEKILVYPLQEGRYQFNVSLYYEDIYGSKYSENHLFTIEVVKKKQSDYFFLVLFLMFLGAVFLVYKIRKKKR